MEKRPIVIMAAMDAEYDLLLEKINIKSKSKIRKFYIF
jgi:hypothetical protein